MARFKRHSGGQSEDLVGAWPPPPGSNVIARWQARRTRPFPGLPDAAFEQPIYEGWPRRGARFAQINAIGARSRGREADTRFARFILINDPTVLKHVLVDNVANYPKSRLERRGLAALIGTGLLASDGPRWRRRRRFMAPSFHPARVSAGTPNVVAACAGLARSWCAREGQVIDVAADMWALALAIVARATFADDSDALVDVLDVALKQALAATRAPSVERLPLIGAAHQRRREDDINAAFADVDAYIAAATAARRGDAATTRVGDILSELALVRDEAGSRLAPGAIRDELMTVLIAGVETTAAAASWIWYLLARHPEVEARLWRELDGVLGGRAPSGDDIGKLVFTRQVVQETLRLYPPAAGLAARACLVGDAIGDVYIPEGANVVIVPFVLHRHYQLWHDPARFDPDRFSPEQTAVRPRLAYLPFGAGPRTCIGQTKTMNFLVALVATLAQSHTLRLAPVARIGFAQGMTLRPSDLMMSIRLRA